MKLSKIIVSVLASVASITAIILHVLHWRAQEQKAFTMWKLDEITTEQYSDIMGFNMSLAIVLFMFYSAIAVYSISMSIEHYKDYKLRKFQQYWDKV